MRKKYIMGNWKMNTSKLEGSSLIREIIEGIDIIKKSDSEVVVAPPFTILMEIHKIIENTPIILAAQNASYEISGAHTGEISISMLKNVGVEIVLLGHSERRMIYGETDSLINKKIICALENRVRVVLCIGETLKEREEERVKEVVNDQLISGLASISSEDIKDVIIAYEPVWAIGTGKTASPKEANAVHTMIRERIAQMYSTKIADDITIVYGGSVKPDNAEKLFSEPNIDGALVGGASLDSKSFLSIIDAMK